MQLTSQEERALKGEEGGAKQLSMEILTKVGDATGADRLVPIKSAHVLAHYSSLHEAGVDMLERFANAGGRFAVPTTVDPASVDLENWKLFGIEEDYAEMQFRLCNAYARLGGIPCWTCVPYQVCNFPKAGETVAWAESNAVVFANSLIGCRTNKMVAGLDLACAITGLTPRFGMLLDENRRADVLFSLELKTLSDLDYRSIGFYIGRNSGSKVPALAGIPPDASSDALKHLGSAAAASGPVTMIHYVGLTPGSDTAEKVAGGRSLETIQIGRKQLDEVEEELNQTDERPDLVALGVPHLSPTELGELARLVRGRKLKQGTKMYVYTSSMGHEVATKSGIRDELEASGAALSQTTDGEISPLEKMGFSIVMTNSAKMAELVSSEGEIKLRYKPVREILDEVME